jgi:hypothetical protein
MSPYVDEIIAIPTRALLKNVNRLCTACQIAGVHGGGSPIMEDIAIMGPMTWKTTKEWRNI